MAQKDFLTSRIQDAAEMAAADGMTSFLDFYEPSVQLMTEREIARYPGCECFFFGGHEYCERKMMCISPQGKEPQGIEYPIDCIHIQNPSDALTHQDVLGALMNLGIEREKTGDINIGNGLIQLFVSVPLGELIVRELSRISRYSVEAKSVPLTSAVAFEPNFVTSDIIVPSMRADAVIHAVYKLSRSEASALIKAEKVRVNHVPIGKPSVMLKEGDIVSVRSKGRMILALVGGMTKKGNIKLTVKKFA